MKYNLLLYYFYSKWKRESVSFFRRDKKRRGGGASHLRKLFAIRKLLLLWWSVFLRPHGISGRFREGLIYHHQKFDFQKSDFWNFTLVWICKYSRKLPWLPADLWKQRWAIFFFTALARTRCLWQVSVCNKQNVILYRL